MCTPKARSDREASFSCSGHFTRQDLHLPGLVANLLKGDTAENSGGKFPHPKVRHRRWLCRLVKNCALPSRAAAPLPLNTAPSSHFETFVTSLPSPAKRETQSRVRCHTIPRSAGAPAGRNTARSIAHLIRTFNCSSHTQGHCFPNRIIKEKSLEDPSQPGALRAWPPGRRSHMDGWEEEEDAQEAWSIPFASAGPARVAFCWRSPQRAPLADYKGERCHLKKTHNQISRPFCP